MNKLLPVALLGFCLGFATPPNMTNTEKLCDNGGRIAFVQHRGDADCNVRFVQSGHAADLRFTQQGGSAGKWRVVGINERPDVKVFVQSYSGSNTVDVKIMNFRSGCK